jgi:PIN like domain
LSTVYFTDRDLGRQFPAILRAGEIAVEEHGDHFDPSTPDDVWLAEIANRRWVAITHDRRIRYKANERDAVMQAGIALLVVIGNAPYPELASNFVRTIDRIERFLEAHEPPFIAKVYRPQSDGVHGRVELWLSHEDWLKRNRGR